jgi:hypothetical protein
MCFHMIRKMKSEYFLNKISQLIFVDGEAFELLWSEDWIFILLN